MQVWKETESHAEGTVYKDGKQEVKVSLRVWLYYSVCDGRQFKSWKNLKLTSWGRGLQTVLSGYLMPCLTLLVAYPSHSQCVFLAGRTASLSKG